jgi:cytochrome P450
MSIRAAFSYEDLARRRAQQVSVPLTLDVYEWYQEMLRSHAVMFDPARASWLVFGYEEVQRVLLNPQTFSSQRQVDTKGNVDPIRSASILGMDPHATETSGRWFRRPLLHGWWRSWNHTLRPLCRLFWIKWQPKGRWIWWMRWPFHCPFWSSLKY